MKLNKGQRMKLKCPHCPKKYDRAQGLGIHKSRIHGIKGKTVHTNGNAKPTENGLQVALKQEKTILNDERARIENRLSHVDALIAAPVSE